ncbi:MAG: 2-amino-5-chloromuconate deaminase CnbZ [Bradyrhizobium sp.]
MSTRTIKTVEARAGGYRFIPAVSQYSGGVGALPGFALERVRFAKPIPLRVGFDRVAAVIKAAGRPLTAFCACELRSPAPFTEAGFKEFNAAYTSVLSSWGVMIDGVNPIARSNVCPAVQPPAEPGFHAFTYVVPASDAAPSFMISGSGEATEGPGDYRERIVRLGDVSPDGMREKAISVLREMERRMSAFSGGWPDTTAVQIYSVRDIFPFVEDELGKRGALSNGLTWHFNRPPVVGLEYEMDCRRIHRERVLEA